tara:strand:+ start:280 stop:519 length:240 start_codon:yes stop_codon:yes gene_type:complete
MRREDVIELIRCEMPDLTDGPFDVKIESDDGGSHICISIEFHEDSQAILSHFFRYHDQDILVKKVPEGWLNSLISTSKD